MTSHQPRGEFPSEAPPGAGGAWTGRGGAVHWDRIAARLEHALYFGFFVPLVAFLPAPLAYGIACRRGDWRYRLDAATRDEILRNLEVVLGDQFSSAERATVTRDYLRVQSCRPLDLMRLAGRGRALLRLVEIRGLEHVEAALAAGKGAIIGSAHFGSCVSAFSLLGACGFPITVIARPLSKVRRRRSRATRFLLNSTYRAARMRHRRGPDIEPWEGQLGAAVQAADVLRRNELVGTMLDPYVLPADRGRAVHIEFLNGQATLLPGTITLAQLTGAPLLMMFMRRSEDWRHQILEISPPVPLDGDPLVTFKACIATIDAAIRRDPAHWIQWKTGDLEILGLLPREEPDLGVVSLREEE